MKIDLHLHTKVTKSDPKNSKRNAPKFEDFKKILNTANVGIGAITNHNEFDFKQFNELSDNDNSYILLPGIEYDVDISINSNDKIIRKQLNIIFSPKKVNDFVKKVNNNPSSSRNPIKIEKIINTFDDDETIFYLDFKGGKTSWKEEEWNKHFSNKIKGLVILDTNNPRTQYLLMSKKYNSLIGSDLQNWDEYIEKDSLKLINTDYENLNYSMLVNILKGKNGVEIFKKSNALKKKEEVELSIKKNKKITLKNIPITSGVNVIFGPKSTGKTELLKKIYEKNKENETSTLYESEERLNYYKNIIEDKETPEDKELENNIKEFKEIIKNMSEFKEEKFEKFKDFFSSINSTKLFKIQETKIKNVVKPKDFNKIKKLAVSFKENFYEIKKFNNSEIIELNSSPTIKTIDFLKNEYLNKIKEFEKNKILKEIGENISLIIKENRGDISMPTEINLFKEYENRKKFFNNVEKLKKIKLNYEFKIKNFEIPDGNIWTHKKIVKFINVNNKKPYNNMNIKELKKYNSFDFSNTHKNGLAKAMNMKYLEKPNNEIIENLKKIFSENFPLYTIINEMVNQNNESKEPSNGEKAFISLFSKLDENSNTFYLDEPETYLGSEMISKNLIEKISKLNISGKKIFLTTHRSMLGINTMPFNMIFRSEKRDEKDEKIYKTYYGNFIIGKFKNINDESDEIDFVETLLQNFEGDINQFNFRKEVYEKNNEIEIKFSTKKEENKNFLIVKYSEKEEKLNMSEESLNEINSLNDFILENINQYQIKFIIEDKESDNVSYKVLKKIVEIYKKEYNEIKNDLEEMSLQETN